MELKVIDKNNKEVSTVEIADAMKDAYNKKILYYAVKAARNNLRHGTASVKDRSDVNKTNKKIYRQKGTGNARHASRKANIFVGGGSAFGPHPRSYNEHVNKKFKLRSYQEVFKYLIQENKLKVVNELSFEKPSAKEAQTLLGKLGLTKAVVVLSADNTNAKLSFRNLKDVSVVNDNNLSLYEMLRRDAVVMTQGCFSQVKERYSL